MLQPEITAFETRIVSVDGYSIDGYTPLSGTSMASPEIAGMAALLYQSQQTKDVRFGDQTFFSRAQSERDVNMEKLVSGLLMSTVEPMRTEDGSYYTLLRQGAGLANVKNAILAESYIDVKGQTRGRVKAEAAVKCEWMPDVYKVTVDIERDTSNALEEAAESQTVTFGMQFDKPYFVVDAITVTIDGKELESQEYNFDEKEKTISIPGEKVTRDIVATVTIVKLPYTDAKAVSGFVNLNE